MPRRPKSTRGRADQTSARYLDDLGHESARAYAFVLSAQANFEAIPLPLPDEEVNKHFDVTVTELVKQGRLPWQSLTSDRRIVFTMAWIDEMSKLGVRG
jgi:hypothetical protein